MPIFEFQGKSYNNPVELSEEIIGGKWKMPILWRLKDRVWRYNELQKSIGKVTAKMLTEQLRELERDGLIRREVFPVIPPKVEYSITPLGSSCIPIIDSFRQWAFHYMKQMKKRL